MQLPTRSWYRIARNAHAGTAELILRGYTSKCRTAIVDLGRGESLGSGYPILDKYRERSAIGRNRASDVPDVKEK